MKPKLAVAAKSKDQIMEEKINGPLIDYAQLKKDDQISNSLENRIKMGNPPGNVMNVIPVDKKNKSAEVVFKLVQKGKKPVLAEVAKS